VLALERVACESQDLFDVLNDISNDLIAVYMLYFRK